MAIEQKEIDRTRYFELKKQLEEASRLYYKDGISPMSDQDFDLGSRRWKRSKRSTRNCAARIP